MVLNVQGMDHIVLNVADVERSVAFYGDVLGLGIERLDEWRAGKTGFPSVRLSDVTIIDLVGAGDAAETSEADDDLDQFPPWVQMRLRSRRLTNLNHFCLVVGDEALEPIVEHLAARGVGVHVGPARRWGARGTGVSVYLRDPDGNEIEIRTYASVAIERLERSASAAARSGLA